MCPVWQKFYDAAGSQSGVDPHISSKCGPGDWIYTDYVPVKRDFSCIQHLYSRCGDLDLSSSGDSAFVIFRRPDIFINNCRVYPAIVGDAAGMVWIQ